MRRTLLLALTLAWAALMAMVPRPSAAADTCEGRFLNPITDICWECVLPITIAPPGVCTCPAPYPEYVRFGIVFQFWEPVWIVDVARAPFCFVNLGTSIDPGYDTTSGFISQTPGSRATEAFYQLHVYEDFFYTDTLGSTVSSACKLDYSGGPDYGVEWFTEFDPTWSDDELAFILGQEAALFANVVSQTACAADCVSATAGTPLDALFWCAGCQGSIYPMGGRTSEQTGGVMASDLLAERLIAKMHRQLMAWDTTSWECGSTPAPIIKKSQYRLQITYPIPGTGIGCPAFGASEVPEAVGQEVPYTGEDFGYLIWRERRCCVSD